MKIKFILLSLLAFVLCMSIVSAAVSVTTTIDKDHPLFGSESFQASNPDGDDDNDEDRYDPGNILVTNNANETVTITNITYVINGDFSTADLDITLVNPVTINPNAVNVEVPLKARVSEKLDAVESDEDSDDYLVAMAFKVATISLVNEQGNVITTFEAFMQRENNFKFKGGEVSVSVNGDSYDDLKDGDKIKDLRPGYKFDFQVTAENDYSTSDDVNFDDFDVELLLTDKTDSDWEWDEIDLTVDDDGDWDSSSVDSGEDNDGTIEDIELDEDIDENGDFLGYVYLWGEDDYGAIHGEKMEIKFDIDRPKYDFVLKKAELSSDVIRCDGSRSLSMDISVESLGKNSDDEISLYVVNKDIGLDYSAKNLELDGFDGSDDSFSKRVSISVSDDVRTGTYPIRVELYYSGDKGDGVQADVKDVDLIIESCTVDTPTNDDTADVDTDDNNDIIIDTTTDSTSTTVNNQPSVPDFVSDSGYVETTETSFRDTRAFDVLLVSLVIILSASLIFLVSKFLF